MNEWPTKTDIGSCSVAIETYCKVRAGIYKDSVGADELRSSWKKIVRFIEINLRKTLKNEW